MAGKSEALDGIMSQLGEFGKYQMRQHLLHLVSSFTVGVHVLALTFTAATPVHRCYIPQIDNGLNPGSFNLSAFIPHDSDGEPSSCLKFILDDHGSNPTTETCGGLYKFDTTSYHSSRVVDWNLVCDRSWMRSLLQTIYMFGMLVGSMVCGALADHFGRKPIFCLIGLLQVVSGLACAFAPSYPMYIVCVFVYGVSGIYGSGFVLTMELVGVSKRVLCGTLFSITFALGEMLVPLWAWLIPNVRMLQIIYAAHSLLIVGHWWLIDESIPWLWSKGRREEAVQIATKAMEMNGRKFKPQKMDAFSVASGRSSMETVLTEDDQKGLISLFRKTNLRRRMLIMVYFWFACSLGYYGLAFSIGTLPGNPFLMSFLMALAEMPAYIMNIVLLSKMGRRSLGSILCFLGGLACIVVAFIPQGAVIISFSMVAKVAISGAFAIAYNYVAELFPTTVRNSVMGIAMMGARLAGMGAPLVILLGEVTDMASLPSIVFGGVAVIAAVLTLCLPETRGKEMPQGIEDGERFGKGDNAFMSIWRKCRPAMKQPPSSP